MKLAQTLRPRFRELGQLPELYSGSSRYLQSHIARSFISNIASPQRLRHTGTLQSQTQNLLLRFKPLQRRGLLRTGRQNLRFNSSKTSQSNAPTPNPTPHLGSPQPALSLSQRMKKLSREYGWSALGVYLLLSALDFPFCFLAVRLLGTDRIGRWEHAIINGFWRLVSIPFPTLRKQEELQGVEAGVVAGSDAKEGKDWSWGVDEARAMNSGDKASIWTQLALAYAVHKSFIFIRVPLTAAVTPKVVKTLRKWGWNIGKRKPSGP